MKKVSLYVLVGLMAGGVSAKVDSGFYAGVGASWNNNKYKQTTTSADNGFLADPTESYDYKFQKNTIAPEIFLGYLCVGKSMAWAPELRIAQNFGSARSYNVINNRQATYQTARVKKRLNLGLDMKLGRIVKESTFVYGVVGLDLTRYKVSYDQVELNAINNPQFSKTKYIPGLKVGAGADIYTNKNLFFGGEVGYVMRAKNIKTTNIFNGGGVNQTNSNKLRPKNGFTLELKAGWKF